MKSVLKQITLWLIAMCLTFAFFAGGGLFFKNKTANAESVSNTTDVLQFIAGVKDLAGSDGVVFDSIVNSGDEILDSASSVSTKFALKRLIVNGDVKNNFGAIKDITGYKNYHILCYETKQQTEYAYNQLIKDENLVVAIDDIIESEAYYDTTYSYSSYNSWGAEVLDVEGYKQYLGTTTSGKREVVVVVIDSGINTSHELFTNRILKDSSGNLVGDSYYTSLYTYSGYSFEDDMGHGSHVAGTIVELTPSNVKILPIKIFDGTTRKGARSYIVAAMASVTEVYATKYEIVCVNMSLGGDYTSAGYSQYYSEIQTLKDNGILTCVAAGNDSQNASNHLPAACGNAITVSALSKGAYAPTFASSYSNYGSVVDVSAPGTSIKSAVIASSNGAASSAYANYQGTSMATPHVTAAVALYKLGNPTYTVSQLETLLIKESIDLGTAGKDAYYGYGVVNLRHFEMSQKSTEVKFYDTTNENYLITDNAVSDLNSVTYTYNFSNSLTLGIASGTNYDIYYTTSYLIPSAKRDNLYSSTLTITDDTTITVVAYYNSFRTKVYRLNLVRDDTRGDFIISTSGYITGYTGNDTHIVVPDTIDGIVVKGIDSNVFENNALESIVFPNNSYFHMNSGAFKNCKNLKKVYGLNVTSIASSVFYGCTSIETISSTDTSGLYFPKLSLIYQYAFYGCTNLTTADIPKVTLIKYNAFYGCNNLNYVNAPLLATIGDNAFYGTSKLTNFDFGSNLTELGNYAFMDSGLESFTLSPSNTNFYTDGIGLYGKNELELVVLKDSTATYTVLSNVTINGTLVDVTTIGEIAFCKTTMQNLYLPNSITSLHVYAFYFAQITNLYYYPISCDMSSLPFVAANIINLYIDANVYEISSTAFAQASITNVIFNSSKVKLEQNLFSFLSGNVSGMYFEQTDVDNDFMTSVYNSGLANFANAIYSKEKLTLTSDLAALYTNDWFDGEYYVYSKSGTSSVYTINASSVGEGSVLPSGVTKVLAGADFTIDILPNDGYFVSDVKINGTSVSTNVLKNIISSGKYTFSNVSCDNTFVVTFKQNAHTIAATCGENGTISPSGNVSVSEGDSQTFVFTANANYKVSKILVDGIELTGLDLTYAILNGYTFENVTANHTIYVEFTHMGYKIDASASNGGTISPGGESIVSEGKGLTYTIAPSEGYELTSVIIDGTAVSNVVLQSIISSGTYTFTSVQADHTIEAIFSIMQLDVLVTTSANGSVSPSGSFKVDYNQTVVFEITPNSGYHLKNIKVNSVDVSALILSNAVASGTFEKQITNNTEIYFEFEINVYTITATQSAGGQTTPNGETSVNAGGSVYYYFTPNEGYFVSTIKIDGVSLSGNSLTAAINNGYTFENITQNHTIYVEFTIYTYTLTASSNGGGSISPSGTSTVNHGDSKTFTFAANEGYELASILIDGNALSNDDFRNAKENGYTFAYVNGNHTIQANFEIIKITITSVAGENGNISPKGVIEYQSGDNVTYTFMPNEGYLVSIISVDGITLTDAELENAILNGYTFTNIVEDHTIAVWFEGKPLTITASASVGGTISPNGISNLKYGDSITYTITKQQGHYVASIMIDGISVSEQEIQNIITNGYTFENIKQNHTISVAFEIEIYSIKAIYNEYGTIKLNGNSITSPNLSIYEYGTSATYVFVPIEGYNVASIKVDGVYISSDKLQLAILNGYTFENISANHEIEATFSANEYSITADSNTLGTITPAGVISASYGESKTFTFSPNEGAYLNAIIIDGEPLSQDELENVITRGYTFKSISNSHSIYAEFKLYTFTIVAMSNLYGKVYANGHEISTQGEVVNYGESLTYTFTPNPNYYISNIEIDGNPLNGTELQNAINTGYTFSNINANHTIYVEFEKIAYTITLIVGENGSIKIEDNTYETGEHTYQIGEGESTLVEFFSNTGFYVNSIIVDGAEIKGTELQSAIIYGYVLNNVNKNHTICVDFESYKYVISATSGENGSITPSGESEVGYGEDITYTFIPNNGYHILSIIVDGNALLGTTLSDAIANGYTFNFVTANHTISVAFAVNEYIITAASGENGTISPSGEVGVSLGGNITFTFVPNKGYYVSEIIVDGTSLNSEQVLNASINGYTFENVTENHTITVEFDMYVFSLILVSGENGKIVGDFGEVENETKIIQMEFGSFHTITFRPNQGYYISKILVDGKELSSTDKNHAVINGYLIGNVKASKKIEVVFEILTFVIKASSGENGSIMVNGNAPSANGEVVNYGADLTYTFTADNHYQIKNILIDGVELNNVQLELAKQNGYTFQNITADHTIYVEFAKIEYIITASASVGGIINPSGASRAYSGENKLFSFSALEGYYITSILIDNVALENTDLQSAIASGEYEFVKVGQNHTISVAFAKYSYTINISSNNFGSVTPNGEHTKLYGESLLLQFEPQSGYHLASLEINGTKVQDAIKNIETKGYLLNSIKQNYSIVATFSINLYDVIFSIDGEGTAEVVGGNTQIQHGASVTLKIVPNKGWAVKEIFVNNQKVELVGSLVTINAVYETMSVSVIFIQTDKQDNSLVIAISIIAGILLFAVLPLVIMRLRKRRAYKSNPILPNSLNKEQPVQQQTQQKQIVEEKQQIVPNKKLSTEEILKTINSATNNSAAINENKQMAIKTEKQASQSVSAQSSKFKTNQTNTTNKASQNIKAKPMLPPQKPQGAVKPKPENQKPHIPQKPTPKK